MAGISTVFHNRRANAQLGVVRDILGGVDGVIQYSPGNTGEEKTESCIPRGGRSVDVELECRKRHDHAPGEYSAEDDLWVVCESFPEGIECRSEYGGDAPVQAWCWHQYRDEPEPESDLQQSED